MDTNLVFALGTLIGLILGILAGQVIIVNFRRKGAK
jgi:hypothetical protein